MKEYTKINLGHYINSYEPIPKDSHKSFYGKAIIEEWEGGQVLRSYNTYVAFKDKEGHLYNLWGGWSSTTGRHIASAFGVNKREYENLPHGEKWGDVVTIY